LNTKIKRNLPTHVVIRNTSILPEESTICLEQIKTIDKMRLGDYRGNVGKKILKSVDDAIVVSLGIRRIKEHINPWSELVKKGSDSIMIQEKKKTIYDEKKTDWMALAQQQLDFFININQYIINLENDKAKLDEEIEDILNYTETTNYNAVQGYKVYRMLRDRRVVRKDLIREISSLEAFVENFDCEVMRKAYQSSLDKMKSVDQNEKSSKVIQELIEMAI